MGVLSFVAHSVVVEDQEEGWLIGFADDRLKPEHYLMIQRAYEFDAQDIQFGMATYHLERDDQAWAGYGGVASFELHRDRAIIRLNAEGALQLDILGLDISFQIDDESFVRLREQLQRIFSGDAGLLLVLGA